MAVHLVRTEDSLVDLLSSEALSLYKLKVHCTFPLDSSQNWIVDLITASVRICALKITFSNGFIFHKKNNLCIKERVQSHTHHNGLIK